MNDKSRRMRVRHALEEELSFLDTTPRQRERIFAYATGGNTVNRKIRWSFGLILALVLMSLSVTALAVSAVIGQYYARVAQMDAEGALTRWNLEDKIRFVETMREFEFEMDEGDYALMTDEARPEEEREAAADRIVDARYGALIQEQIDQWIDQPDSRLGIAPDEIIIFKERYMAEHPEGISNWDDLVQFTDSLGYYLRDEYYPALKAAQGNGAEPAPREINEAYAVEMLKDYMTEILGWTPEAVDEMTPAAAWDEEFCMWTVTGEVPADSMNPDWEPTTRGLTIEQTENGYRFSLLVDEKGNFSASTDKAAFRNEHLNDPEEDGISGERAVAIARQAVQEAYQVPEAEMNALFALSEAAGKGEENGRLNRIVFHRHFAYDREYRYAAIVNMATGKAKAALSYQLKDLGPEWTLLTFAAQTERAEGWYMRWKEESKRQLIDGMKQCGVLPGHAFWQQAAPSIEEMDAFVAEACGAPGYASAVNCMALAHALLGAESAWDLKTSALFSYLKNQYNVMAADVTEALTASGGEIDGETAAAIIRQAVCQAWEETPSALDGWDCQAQLVHDSVLGSGMVFYRVFLARPLNDAAPDSFGGRNSLAYRVLLDGTVADASMQPAWYSPAQDRAVWEERKLYDGELFHLFDLYAQKNGLLYDYEDFFHWPIEHKTAFLKEARPIMEEKATQDPRLLALLRHAYILPENGMLSQQQAEEKARGYLGSQFGFAGEEMRYLLAREAFLEAADRDGAYWKIVFSAEAEWSSAQLAGVRPDRYYAVELDAKTGGLIRAYFYGRLDGQTGADAWNRWY